MFVVPCLFWFTQDIQQAFLSGAIPYGQRYVAFDVAAPANLVDKAARYKQVMCMTELSLIDNSSDYDKLHFSATSGTLHVMGTPAGQPAAEPAAIDSTEDLYGCVRVC